jgi:hypothetical protein
MVETRIAALQLSWRIRVTDARGAAVPSRVWTRSVALLEAAAHLRHACCVDCTLGRGSGVAAPRRVLVEPASAAEAPVTDVLHWHDRVPDAAETATLRDSGGAFTVALSWMGGTMTAAEAASWAEWAAAYTRGTRLNASVGDGTHGGTRLPDGAHGGAYAVDVALSACTPLYARELYPDPTPPLRRANLVGCME